MPPDVQQIIAEQFDSLPEVVRHAVKSGDMQDKFRGMAQKYQIHIDQWQQIENLIMLTILGLSKTDELVGKIVSETNIGRERAEAVVDDIAISIFKPIREELERELGHPSAHEEQISDVEKVRDEVLSEAKVVPLVTQTSEPTPSTPPPPPPTQKVERGPASGAYKPGETSAARKGLPGVMDDPYREPPK